MSMNNLNQSAGMDFPTTNDDTSLDDLVSGLEKDVSTNTNQSRKHNSNHNNSHQKASFESFHLEPQDFQNFLFTNPPILEYNQLPYSNFNFNPNHNQNYQGFGNNTMNQNNYNNVNANYMNAPPANATTNSNINSFFLYNDQVDPSVVPAATAGGDENSHSNVAAQYMQHQGSGGSSNSFVSGSPPYHPSLRRRVSISNGQIGQIVHANSIYFQHQQHQKKTHVNHPQAEPENQQTQQPQPQSQSKHEQQQQQHEQQQQQQQQQPTQQSSTRQQSNTQRQSSHSELESQKPQHPTPPQPNTEYLVKEEPQDPSMLLNQPHHVNQIMIHPPQHHSSHMTVPPPQQFSNIADQSRNNEDHQHHQHHHQQHGEDIKVNEYGVPQNPLIYNNEIIFNPNAGPIPGTSAWKKQKILERNRVAASKCRQKKKVLQERQQEDINRLLMDNNILKEKNKFLEAKIKTTQRFIKQFLIENNLLIEDEWDNQFKTSNMGMNLKLKAASDSSNNNSSSSEVTPNDESNFNTTHLDSLKKFINLREESLYDELQDHLKSKLNLKD